MVPPAFLAHEAEAFPAEPVDDASSFGLVLSLCLTGNLGMGIHAGVPKKAVTSSSLRKGPAHTFLLTSSNVASYNSLPWSWKFTALLLRRTFSMTRCRNAQALSGSSKNGWAGGKKGLQR